MPNVRFPTVAPAQRQRCEQVRQRPVTSLEGTARIGSEGRFRPASGADADGRPEPVRDVTVRLESHARILIYEPERLAALIDTDSDARAAWQARTYRSDHGC